MKILKTKNLTTMSLVTILIITTVGLIPLGLISSLVKERKNNKYQVTNEIENQWGSGMTIGNYSLSIPYSYKEQVEVSDTNNYNYNNPKITKEVTKHSFFKYSTFEEKSKVVANVKKRYRGIYSVPIYNAKVVSNFIFKNISFEKIEPSHTIMTKSAYLKFGLGTGKEISNIVIKINGVDYEAQAVNDDVGVELNLEKVKFPLNVSLKFDYKGTRFIKLAPTSKKSHFEIKANWKDPKFIGDRLPSMRKITKDGFVASWDITNFTNRNNEFINQSLSGVELFDVLDIYQINERTLKYGTLFIFLTFIGFFIISVINKVNIHPIQYGFIMGSMIEFYFLLLSFSEHINFSLSYLIATMATIGTISLYSKSIFKGSYETLFVFAELILLYSFLYLTIVSKDYALLTGSIGLLLVLCVSMFATRNVTWKVEDTQATA